ncbi:unnamed protein product [Candidula unifasciata]|uniref:G-protein coupled receptors family 1 profile domain-containing protein n=1 Tax=Candidula unifasciata TaxID=100452 RepID=A0A8S3Z353_9EUPU|nr:unnamed protein product [Candidula unifasciata]
MHNSSINYSEHIMTVTDVPFSNAKDTLNIVTAGIPHRYIHDKYKDVFLNITVAGSTNDSNDSQTLYPFLRQPIYMVVILSLAYASVFVCAVLGNICVLCVVSKDRRFHSATYYLMANLAVADFIVAIVCQPITLMSNLLTGKMCGLYCCLSEMCMLQYCMCQLC